MAIDVGLTQLGNFFGQTTVFGISWLIHLILTALTLAYLSKDPNDWKELSLPVVTLWHIVGIVPSFLIYILSALVFGIEMFSQAKVTALFSTVRKSLELKPTSDAKMRKRLFTSEVRRRMKSDIRQKAQDTKDYVVTTEDLLKAIKKGK